MEPSDKIPAIQRQTLRRRLAAGRPAVENKESKNLRIRREAAALIDDPIAFAAFPTETAEFLKTAESRASPSEHLLWAEATVLKYYRLFLPYMVAACRSVNGKIKAKTLEEKMMLLIYAIAKYTCNEAGDLTGPILLSRSGQKLICVVKEHDLERHLGEKIYYGKSELKLLIEEAFKNSKKSGRIVARQRVCILTFIFFTAVRPSSLAPCDKQYLIEKKNWFNVPFDVVLYFVLMPFTRCALEGIKTLDDLRKPGDKVPPAPMSASPLMMMMRNLGNRAGLPGATFRRGAANEYEVTIGKELTEIMLAHTSSGARDMLVLPLPTELSKDVLAVMRRSTRLR
ncbi:hypothetical protein BJ912DRAFT_1057922 [Pholiota molesta]|nr:hypothetical protein BJ912DRAFT_1057922 [Pholiota molesta]